MCIVSNHLLNVKTRSRLVAMHSCFKFVPDFYVSILLIFPHGVFVWFTKGNMWFFFTLQKIDGCNKMTCTGCRQYFCWLCKNMLSRGNPYDHYNDPSSGCFNKYVYVFTLTCL